jgi:hypothetical protein
MNKTATISLLVSMSCLFVASMALAGSEVSNNPIWNICEKGKATSIEWISHESDPRFAICKAGTPLNISDDMVLDRETGLIWARNANLPDMVKRWIGAIRYCRNLTLGNRKGWRLPSIEELSSLVDPRQGYPALPKGHPFKNVGITYCTDTTDASNSDKILYVRMTTGTVYSFSKSDLFYVWPVRGGKGQSKMK